MRKNKICKLKDRIISDAPLCLRDVVAYTGTAGVFSSKTKVERFVMRHFKRLDIVGCLRYEILRFRYIKLFRPPELSIGRLYILRSLSGS